MTLETNPPDVDIGGRLVVVSYVLIFPTVITTALRFWARTSTRALGNDDWFILAATACAVVLSAVSIAGVAHGKGHHEIYLSKDQINVIGELSFVNQIDLFTMLCLIKMSICFLVLRIHDARWLKFSLWAVMVFMVATTVESIISLLAECHPVRAFWNRSLVKDGVAYCHSPDLRIYSIYLQAGTLS